MDAAGYYQETSVMTHDKGRLVVLLYDGAIKYLKQSIFAMDAGNFEQKGELIYKAQNILFELNNVLDIDKGGQIAENLRKLYNFMYQRLNQASIQCDRQIIREVIELLSELNEGWKAVAC